MDPGASVILYATTTLLAVPDDACAELRTFLHDHLRYVRVEGWVLGKREPAVGFAQAPLVVVDGLEVG